MNDRPKDLIDTTEAGKVLGVSRSSATRYIDRYADALKPVRMGRQKLVSRAALVRHREENLGVDAPVEQERTREALGEKHAQADARTRKITAEASRAEIDLAERKRELVPARDVVDAAGEAIAEMRAAGDKALDETAERIAAKLGTEARLVRPHLKAMIETMFGAFSNRMFALKKANEPMADPTAEMAGKRIEVAGHA